MLLGIEYISTKLPSTFVFEHTRALALPKQRTYFETILNKLHHIKDSGTGKQAYNISWKVLDMKTHGGLPQARARVYVVGVLARKQVQRFVFPTGVKCAKVDTLLQPVCQHHVLCPDVSGMSVRNMRHLVKGLEEVIERGGSPTDETWFVDCTLQSGRRMKPMRDICPNLTKARAALGGFWVTNLHRRLYLEEILGLQGMDTEGFTGPVELCKQHLQATIANTIAVPVLARVLLNMCKAVGLADPQARVH